MTKNVNFGIDLGTTNSLIAKFDKGNVEIFKNPNGFKESLLDFLPHHMYNQFYLVQASLHCLKHILFQLAFSFFPSI